MFPASARPGSTDLVHLGRGDDYTGCTVCRDGSLSSYVFTTWAFTDFLET